MREVRGQSLGIEDQPLLPSPSAEARGISGYRYQRSGSVITVEVIGALQGKSVAVMTMEWPEDQGATIDCTTVDGRRFHVNWREDHGYLKIEDDRGIGVEARVVDGRWEIDGERVENGQNTFLLKNKETIGFIVDVYEDALTNLGLRQYREQMLLQTRSTRGLSTSAPEEPQGQDLPPVIEEKIICGLHACDGQLWVESEDGITRESCCADGVFWVNIDCALTSPCSQCCHLTCNSLCLIDQTFCSCTVTGRACHTPIDCGEEWPPPCT
jgi:hypothetical protein